MNTENLTDKQKANRAYYAKHAEKIKAQKREYYARTKADKPKKAKTTKPAIKKQTVIVENGRSKRKVEVRRCIEDLMIEKELIE